MVLSILIYIKIMKIPLDSVMFFGHDVKQIIIKECK